MPNINRTILFTNRPAPVLPEHRPLYKIGQILLILYLASRGGKSSLPRLHLFNWALKRQERKNLLIEASEKGALKVPAWGFDPALAIAIHYATHENLLQGTSTGYAITMTGIQWIKKVVTDADCFGSEKQFLEQVGKSITENMVSSVSQSWGDS